MSCAAEVVARQYIAALNRGDTERIFSLFADEAEVAFPGGGRLSGAFRGKEGLKRLYSPKGKEVAVEFETTITNTVARDGLVAMEFHSRIAGAAKRGAFDSFGSLFFEIQDGRIQRLSIYLTEPAAAKVGGINLSEELSVADMGALAVAVWAVV